jgi:hypothetical protein
MIWPSIIVDNFFDDPNKILEISKKLSFAKDNAGRWPGERTTCNSQTDKNFYNWLNYKIVRLLYPMNHEQMTWTCSQYFQKVNGNFYKNEGWIHSDAPWEFTAIIYLSKHKNCGTSLFTKKKFFNNSLHIDKKENIYKKGDIKNELKYLKENNDLFESSLTVDSKFNRLFLFDSNQYHAANNFKDKDHENEERLTLITFFYSLTANGIKYPIPEMKRDF